jgi:hypothetical protein
MAPRMNLSNLERCLSSGFNADETSFVLVFSNVEHEIGIVDEK